MNPPPRSRASALRGWASTSLLFLVLGVIAFWGIRTEWKFVPLSAVWGGPPAARNNDKKRAGERPGSEGSVKVVPAPEPKSGQPAQSCPLDQTRVEFSSAEVVRKVGIAVAPVREKPLVATVDALAEIDYDQTRVARLSVRVPGTVAWVGKAVGDPVRKDEVVALIDAARVGEAKAKFLQALAQLNLRTRIVENLQKAGEGAVAGQKLQEARAELYAARVRLVSGGQALRNLGLPVPGQDLSKLSDEELDKTMRFLGLPGAAVEKLGADRITNNLVPLRAPLDGVIVERKVVEGEVVDAAATLFVVADVSRVWVMMDVRLEDADQVAVGQPVTFRADGHPGEVLKGRISWLSTTVDEKTRTLRARVDVENLKGHWRARTFGTAQITVRDLPRAVLVPTEAIQREGPCYFVFVLLADPANTFQLREVRRGVRSGKFTEIKEGVGPGEQVAVTGSFVLKSEVLKSRLGQDND